MGRIIPHFVEKKNVPNHQPGYIYIYMNFEKMKDLRYNLRSKRKWKNVIETYFV